MLCRALIVCLWGLPGAALAAGTEPPKSDQTKANCPEGQVYDADRWACVPAGDASFSDQDRFDAAYDLAHGGRPGAALRVLDAHLDPTHPDVLTLRGFATRMTGDWAGGLALYQAALKVDPDHWLARSYLGVGLAERGAREAAEVQLQLIRASGGRGSYPEELLSEMLRTGRSPY